MQNTTRQSGNVLFLILIAVALFASLSYAITKSSSGGKTSTSAEKAQLSQGVIDSYTAGVNAGVMRLQMRGCSTIDYKTPTQWGAEDHKCQVFHPQGGAVIWQDINISVGPTDPCSAPGSCTMKGSIGSNLGCNNPQERVVSWTCSGTSYQAQDYTFQYSGTGLLSCPPGAICQWGTCGGNGWEVGTLRCE